MRKREIKNEEVDLTKPVWRKVAKSLPHCPKCGAELKRTTGDAASMFTWICPLHGTRHCNFVC